MKINSLNVLLSDDTLMIVTKFLDIQKYSMYMN
jgi:hypothetical protein